MDQTIAVVLAGGRSSRMGGEPKCLCPLGKARIIDALLTRLAPQVDDIILNVAPGSTLREAIFTQSHIDPAQIHVVEDTYPDFLGPLAGIASSMQYMRTHYPTARWLLSVASDTPFIPADLYKQLLHAVQHSEHSIYVAQHNHQQHYVIALWNVALLPQLDAILRANKKYRMQDVLRLLDATFVDFSSADQHAFFNVNTPQDLLTAHSIIAQ